MTQPMRFVPADSFDEIIDDGDADVLVIRCGQDNLALMEELHRSRFGCYPLFWAFKPARPEPSPNQRRLAALSPAELERLRALAAAHPCRRKEQPAARRSPARRGLVDRGLAA
jgi:hypothetical protein